MASRLTETAISEGMMTKRAKSDQVGSTDWILIGATLALVAVGLMMVYSSTFDMSYRLSTDHDPAYYFKRQLLWAGIGLVAMYVAGRLDYRHWKKVSIPIMLGALFMLFVLNILGRGRQLLGQSISPSELAKLAMVIYVGHWLASKRVEQLRKLPVGPLPFTIIVGLVTGLVVAQPDLSEAMVIVLVALAMFFVAGADLLQFVVGMVGGIGAFVAVIQKFPPAMKRIEPFLTYWQTPLQSTNDQFRQGLIAMGSGGIMGLGPGNGRMSYRWLPAAHTDSIFCIIGEELGLIGCLIVIGLFAVIAYRGFRIARDTPDPFGRMLAVGITCWITFQAMINMAVVTGTIPFTGIVLPFISLGGSSLVTCMLGVGIVLNVSRLTVAEGVPSHEVSSVGGRDRRSRLSSPDRGRSPA
jgi:cell division protein FtsW